MIEYEDLCAALERYVERNGGGPSPRAVAAAAAAPQAAAPRAPLQMTSSPTRNAAPAPSRFEPPTGETALPPLDAGHDLGGVEDGATHVGASPSAHAHDDGSNEIDIGDVLSDEEL